MLVDRMLVTSLLVLSELKQESPDDVRGSINESLSDRHIDVLKTCIQLEHVGGCLNGNVMHWQDGAISAIALWTLQRLKAIEEGKHARLTELGRAICRELSILPTCGDMSRLDEYRPQG